MIGASGAIAGVLGAYLVMFPHSRVLTLFPIFFFVQIIEVPAVYLLGVWFLMQLLNGFGTLAMARGQDVGGVAFWAHAGGFAAGMLLVMFFRRPERQQVEWWDV
jgi:membrane associated rhomboid family serine protease